jgi:hypothetical protein
MLAIKLETPFTILANVLVVVEMTFVFTKLVVTVAGLPLTVLVSMKLLVVVERPKVFVVFVAIAAIVSAAKLVTDKLVIVALVRVALVPVRLMVLVVLAFEVEALDVRKLPVVEFKVVILPVTALVVVALDVLALEVMKFDVLPKSVPMIAEVMLAMEEKRFVEEAVVAKELVEVELVMVPLLTFISVRSSDPTVKLEMEALFANRLAVVALLRVALIVFKLIELLVVALLVLALLVMKFEDVPKSVAIFAVTAVNVFIKAVRNAAICPVIFCTVVEARVEEPVTSKFPVVVSPEVLLVLALEVEA